MPNQGPTPLARRLRRIMDEMGWRPVDLMRAAKCSKQAVSSWLNGRNENIREAMYAVNIQLATRKFNAAWILTGKGPVYLKLLTPADEKVLDTLKNAPEDAKGALRLIFPGLKI